MLRSRWARHRCPAVVTSRDDPGMRIEPPEFSRIRLLDLPVALYVAAEGRWKALLREYVLRGLGGSVQAYGAEEVARAG